jgi:hypothetical protein
MTHYTNQKYENTDIFEESDIEKIENQITQNPFIEKQKQHIDPSFFRLIPEYLRS